AAWAFGFADKNLRGAVLVPVDHVTVEDLIQLSAARSPECIDSRPVVAPALPHPQLRFSRDVFPAHRRARCGADTRPSRLRGEDPTRPLSRPLKPSLTHFGRGTPPGRSAGAVVLTCG